VASVLAALLSAFCLTLPNTPPLAVGERAASGPREALELVRRPWVAVFLVTAFGVCLTTPFIYQVQPPYLESRGLPRAWISTFMTLGQYPEIAALAVFPWLLRRLHYKGTLALGIAAYLIRYASLACDPPLWVAIAGIPLQGVGVACFTIGGQVFFDGQAPVHRRATAQALLMVLTSGIGSLLGSLLAGEMSRHFPGDYPLVFLVLSLITLGLLIVFWIGFHPEHATASSTDAVPAVRPAWSESDAGCSPAPPAAGSIAPETADG
jgi:MFS family permease